MPEVSGLAADIYLDEQAPDLANPHQAVELMQRVMAQLGDGRLLLMPLLVKALERVGDRDGAERQRRVHAHTLRTLYGEHA
ncbi:MAG: hypothetical protein NZ585_05055 [Chloracidobacterium sp.]|nr:hypothetical protein [Chloracidobacterium sp.]MDW8216670.1 hypothetical protein [Acidobacteriota bacterium]